MSLRQLKIYATAAALAASVALAACSPELPAGADRAGASLPEGGPAAPDKNGTETLGAPELTVADGPGFSHGGVSMVGVDTATLEVEVPADAVIEQVLVYWAGGSTSGAGDDRISLAGVPVDGELIGGPTWFFMTGGSSYFFSAYRADVTDLDLIGPGANSLSVADFDFAMAQVDENDGVSIVVIWDDGSQGRLELRDGLDMAYFGFEDVLNGTEPQTFTVTPASSDRLARLLVLAASVGQDRPNRIIVTTVAGSQDFDDLLGASGDGQWDSVELPVLIPAGADALTVEVVSSDSYTPRGASFGWVGVALAEPGRGGDEPWTISGTVYIDTDRDGQQGAAEPGLPDVVVDLGAPTGAAGPTLSARTDADGRYRFAVGAGSYTVLLDPDSHPGAFNATLAASFAANTPLALPVTVGPDSDGNDFGFVPDTDSLLEDLESGFIETDGLTPEQWAQIFHCAIVAEGRVDQFPDGSYGALERFPVLGDDCGVMAERLYYHGGILRELLGTISGLYLPVPFQFADGNELVQAFKWLTMLPRTDDEALLKELLAAELNYVTGRGTVGQLDLLGALVSWSESLLAWQEDGAKTGEKDRGRDIRMALQVLEAVNTGGGGGVDE